jgi:hypothetical protein
VALQKKKFNSWLFGLCKNSGGLLKKFMSYFVFLTSSENPGFLHAYYTYLLHFPIKNRTLSFGALSN